MTKLVPVDFDPFAGEDAPATQDTSNLKLTPVDGNPFADEDEAALVAAYNKRNPNDHVESLPDRSGILGRAQELGMGMLNAVRDQFPQDMARIARGFTGGTPGDDSYFSKVIDEQQRDMEGRLPSKQVVNMDTLAESLAQGPASIATSLATGVAGGMIGGKAGAIAGSTAGPQGAAVGGVVGAMVGAGAMSGAAFYNLAKDQFLEEMYQKAQKANPNLTQDDWKALSEALDADATEFGLWEAGPEAVSQFFTAGLVKGVGGKVLSKMFPGAAGGIARVGENAIARASAKLAAEVGEEEITEGITFMGQEGIRQRAGLREDAPTLREFANTQAGPVAVGSVLQIGGMGAAERAAAWRNNLKGGTFVDETVQPDVAQAQPVVVRPEPVVIPTGKTIDLTALPSGNQFALPEGTGAMPHGTDATGLAPIPTMADMPSGPTIAMQPTLALPQTTTDAPAGMWPGGRSQLSYPYGGGIRNDIAGVAPEEVMPVGGANDQHKALVAEALNSGKEVPIDVLGAYGMDYPMAQEQTLADEVAALPSMDDGDPFAPAEPAQAMAIEEQGVATDTQAVPTAAQGVAPSPSVGGFDLKPISDKAFVVTGDTKPIKDQLKAAGGKWNPKHKGWMFSNKRQAEVESMLAGVVQPTAAAPEVQNENQGQAQAEALLAQEPTATVQKAQPVQNVAPVMRQRESMNTQADEDKRLVALGQKEVPGIRLGDALDAGRVAEARDRGDVSREEWDSYVSDLVASGRVARQEAAPVEPVQAQEEYGITLDEARAALADMKTELRAQGQESQVHDDRLVERVRKFERLVSELEQGNDQAERTALPDVGPEAEVKAEAKPGVKQEGIATPKADAVKSKREESPKEASDAPLSPAEPERLPAVGRQTDVVDGQPAGSAAGNVQDTEGADEAPGRADGTRSVGGDARKEGGDARGRSSRNQHGDGRASGRAGTGQRESAGADADGGARKVSGLGRQPSRQNAQNHRVADEDTLVPGGTVARAKANIAAIKLLKELQAENRAATPEEKRVLTQFTGWGSLAQEVFKPEFDNAAEYEGRYGRTYPSLTYNRQASEAYDKWKERYGKALHPALGGMMTAEEWDAAKKSTLNAHYTDRSVINAMWSMAERMGFAGGRVLEPSAGTGLFFGLMPEGISEKSRLVGVELDSITGGILQKLYPDADIQVTGFENAKRIGDNSFDMVISNFPFGSFQVYDKARPEYSKQAIHNYFFSRAIDAVKPGGLVMGITSHFTLDAGGTGKVREMWGQKADLVAAVRLPGTAFEKNAGTQVTTDIIILRKKTDTPYKGEQFRHLAEVQTPEGPTQINEYFVQHPEMVLGEHSLQGSMYGGKDEYTLKPSKGESLDAAMKRVAELLPQNIAGRDIAVANDIAPVQAADDGMREGTIVEKDGKVFMVVDGALEAPEWASNAKKASQAKAYLGVKSAALELINAMNTEDGDANVNRLRARLNEVYDAYVKEHGHINKRGNKHLEDDLEFPTVAALESAVEVPVDKTFQTGPYKGQTYTITKKIFSKADIFTKRTIYPFTEPTTAENVADAVKISRVYRNGVNVPYIASLLGMDTETARAELLKTGDVFENPESGLVEPKDIYLSGNVREKLRVAERAANDNPAYQANVDALQKVMPERLSIDAIHVRIGSAWVPADIMKSFMEHIGISYPRVERIRIDGEEGSTQWEVSGQPGADARNKWGVEGADAMDLISDSLNLKRSEVFDTYQEDGKTKRVKNAQKSLAAQEKQRALQEEFRRWVKEDDAAAKTVEEVYNDTFNGHVARKFDAPDIKFYPGASQTIELRENQKIGVSRALQESTLLAHGVGSGKTFLQITLAMEMRRLGTAKKPWIVVQGSTLPQFAASFKRLYPGARILAPNENQRKAKNRQRLLAQIASGDWDAIITPHGFFNSISIDPENEARFINERIEEFEEQIRADYGDKALNNKRENNPTVKAIQRKIEKMKVRLQKLTDTKKDANIFFEQLGVDALIIDEAHAYKRGDFYTKMDNVKGLDRDSSQRSMQMLMKSRHVQEKTGGKNVILATGTPISNTLTEMWTMFRYTRPDLLKAFGVEQFDDFASTFADTTVSLEETSTGDFKDVERFNRFVNGPELLTMWRMGADVAITENLDYIKGLPKLAGGKVQEVAVERSEELTNYIRALKAERDAWDRLSGKEKRESSHVPLVIYGKAKKAAIDLRLVDADLADTPGSKANAVVDSVLERWKRHQDTKAAQIIFSDIFQSSDKRFNLFHDIRDKLIAKGVPAGEIAIIHDFKTDEARGKLFDKVNAGTVRVLMGTTEKLGVGVNVQERLVAAHHIDAPLRPMDFEQRNGRIRRPGNMFTEVEVFAYGTKNTLDSVTFQQLIAKQKFINQMMRGDMGNRVFENPFDEVQATFEDMMAAFSGNPMAKEKMKLQADIRRLESLHSAYTSRLSNMRYELRHAKAMLDGAQKQLPRDEKVVEFISKNFPDGKIEGRKEIAQDIGEWLDAAEKAAVAEIKDVNTQDHWRTLNPKKLSQTRTFVLGNGMKAEVTVTPGVYSDGEGKVEERYAMTSYELAGPHGIEDSQSFTGASGMMTRVENFLARSLGKAEITKQRIAKQEEQIASLEEELKKPFEQSKELDQARERMDEIEKELAAAKNEDLEAGKANQEEQSDEESPTYFRPQYARGENTSGLDAKEVTSLAKPLLDLLTDGTKVNIVQSVADLPEGLRKKMVRDKAENVLGAYYGGTNYLIADNIPTAEDVMFVLKHELFHDGMRRMRERYASKYGRDEAVKRMNHFLDLAFAANKESIMKLANAYRQDFPDLSDANNRRGLTEEWLGNRAYDNAPKWFDRYVAAIRRFIRDVANRLGVKLQFSDAELRDFIRRVQAETGDYGGDGGASAYARPEGASTAGATTAAEAEEAARLWAEMGTESPYFKRWFGDSKVVDKQGKPLVVYRGIPGEADQQLPSSPTGFTWFTSDRLDAQDYNPDQFVETYLSARRVADLDSKRIKSILRKEDIDPDDLFDISQNGSVARRALIDAGYDGAFVRRPDIDKGVVHYAVFSPTQIKSVFNRGTFDANDPRISYMRPEGMPSAKDVAQVVDGFETGDIGELGPLLRLPHWLAKKVPSLRSVVDRQFEREERRSSSLSQSIESIPELFGGDRIKGKDRKQLLDFLWKWDGKNVKMLDETPKFVVAEQRGNRLLLKKNEEWDKTYAEWVKSEGLTGQVAAAAISVRKALDDAFVRGYNRLALMTETPDTMLEEMRSLFMHLDNYMPHSRTGAYGVAVYDKDGEALYREHFDAPSKAVAKIRADKRLKELRKEFPQAARFWAGVNKGMPEEIYEQFLSMDAMEKMLFAAVDNAVDDKAVAADLKKGITMAASDEFKSRGWLSHSIGRKNVPGFERENVERVLFDYFAGHHGFLEKVDAARDMASALKKIDPKTRPNEHAYVVQYVKDMLRNSDKIDRVVGNIKALAFVWYLGGVIKTAAVNATQNIVSGAPTLGLWTKGSSHVRIFDAAMRSVVKDRLSEDEQRLIKELHENGLTQANLIREVQGRVSGKFGSVGNKVISALGWPMAAAERFNRVSLALAAYRAARSGALNDKARSEFGIAGKADHEKAKSFAEAIVRDAHFVYGKSNLPQPLRSSKAGRVASAAYTFRSFNHNMLEMWANALVRHGWQDGGKAILSSMAGTMVLGGLRAAPFFATSMALMNWLAPMFGGTGDDDWLEKIAKMLPKAEWMRDMILFGVPSLAGVDIGGSLRLEAPMVDRSAKYRHGDILGDMVGEALGIPYALVQSVGRAKSAVEAGAPARAVEEIAPVALKNAMAAYRLATEGAHSITGTPIKDPLTQQPKTLSSTEAVFKALGFQAVSQTKASLTQNAVDRTDAVRADKAKLLANRIANAMRDNNVDAVKANLRAWKDWNAKAKADDKPSLLILPQDMKARLRARLAERKTSPRQALRIMQMIDAYGK